MLVVSVICTLLSVLCTLVCVNMSKNTSENLLTCGLVDLLSCFLMQRYGKKKPFESKMKLDGSGWEF